MKDLSSWAPYLSNPLTSAAFIALVVAAVFLGMLKYRASLKMQYIVVSVFIVASLATLLLAIFNGDSRQSKSAEPTASQPVLGNSNNIQMVQGSNNVMINQSGKSK